MSGPDRLAPVHDRMRAAVAGGGPAAEMHHWLRYHLGWADAAGGAADARAAKGVRPLLCLAACGAAGGRDERAIACAAAVELTHEFSLIHDDVQDRDELRRGRPAVWTLVGEAQAINLGDALFALARRQLADAPVTGDEHRALCARYDLACVELAEGQYLDLTFATGPAPTPDQYRVMVERKTGALLGLAAALGALAAGAAPGVPAALERYGRCLGVAFQIADDALGMWGVPAVTGKPAGNDLLQGKKSYPVLLGLQAPALADLMARALAGDAAAQATAPGAMEGAGLRDRCRRDAAALAEEAVTLLEGAVPDSPDRALLAGLARSAADRER